MTHNKAFKKYYISLIVVDKSFLLDYRKRGRLRRATVVVYNKRLRWMINKTRHTLGPLKNKNMDS
jgi:hypothetical protein